MAEDAELVRAVLAGQREPFRELVRRYQDAVFGVALSKTGSMADAEDVAQDAFLAAFETLDKLREPGRFGGWLYAIALNKARLRVRRRRVREKHAASTHAGKGQPATPHELAERRETRSQVMDALARLPDASRETATLYYINGYSQKDISGFTGRPLGTVKRRLHDARARLRKELVAMVEEELKRSRPGREFAEQVLRRISQVRVRPGGAFGHILLLTDDGKRSYVVVVGESEAASIEPWLSGEGSPDATDIHTAVVRALGSFDRRIEELVISELKLGTFYGVLKVTGPGGSAEVDCRPSDGMNLAVRAGAPLFIHKDVAGQCVMASANGKPLTPAQAWRTVQKGVPFMPRPGGRARFANATIALQALRRDPEAMPVRYAVCEATGHLRMKPPLLRDASDGMQRVRRWLKRCRDPELEGIVRGLVGAAKLIHKQHHAEAIPWLEEAHRLCPDEKRIAFDLASAYASEGRTRDALTALRKGDREAARTCGNFRDLWDNRRFRSIVGKPDPKERNSYLILQIWMKSVDKSEPDKKPASKPAAALPALALRSIGAAARGRIERLLDRGPLLHLAAVWPSAMDAKERLWLVLEDEKRRGIPLRPGRLNAGTVLASLPRGTSPRPYTPKAAGAVLRAAGLKVEAAVLTKRGRRGIEGALIVSADGRREAVTMAGAEALAVGMAAQRPILIAESLAEKLYVRGKSGRPFAPRTVSRQLTAGGRSIEPGRTSRGMQRMVIEKSKR